MDKKDILTIARSNLNNFGAKSKSDTDVVKGQ